MARQHNQKSEEVQKLLQDRALKEDRLLQALCRRLCAPPFPKKLGSARLWIEFWDDIDHLGRQKAVELPDPCLNHIESRLRKPERSACLEIGLERILRFDQRMFLEGLRLYPHAVCRTAEAIGPLCDQKWAQLLSDVGRHRLFAIEGDIDESRFWELAELLVDFRELPQPVLDFLDLDRPKEQAPLAEFVDQLQRFLLRSRIEKIRAATYDLLRVHGNQRTMRAGFQ